MSAEGTARCCSSERAALIWLGAVQQSRPWCGCDHPLSPSRRECQAWGGNGSARAERSKTKSNPLSLFLLRATPLGLAEEGQLLAVEGRRCPRKNVLQCRSDVEDVIAAAQRFNHRTDSGRIAPVVSNTNGAKSIPRCPTHFSVFWAPARFANSTSGAGLQHRLEETQPQPHRECPVAQDSSGVRQHPRRPPLRRRREE